MTRTLAFLSTRLAAIALLVLAIASQATAEPSPGPAQNAAPSASHPTSRKHKKHAHGKKAKPRNAPGIAAPAGTASPNPDQSHIILDDRAYLDA